ncbi:MAG: DUF3231 family protein, partial [Tumebacillaceae bacterium]
YALSLSKEHMHRISGYFKEEDFLVPIGFTDKDVVLSAPRLFSDSFFLQYVANMAKIGTTSNGMGVSMSARTDIRTFFTESSASAFELYNKASSLLLSKGLFIRAPYVPIPREVEFIHRERFLDGMIGKQRPVNVIEIAHLWSNAQMNLIGKALSMGFSQVAKNRKVRELLVRGRDISQKHIAVLNDQLVKENLPTTSSWDADVMDSTIAPFSDKLMLFHVASLCQTGLGNYGIASSQSMRRDLSLLYTRLSAEVATYADDMLEVMIHNKWAEQPPLAVDRDELAKV